MANFEINKESTNLVNELINAGWELMLHYGDHSNFIPANLDPINWEADFTRRLKNGMYDNHESGYHLDINEAVKIAYQNIKDGKKLNRKKNG